MAVLGTCVWAAAMACQASMHHQHLVTPVFYLQQQLSLLDIPKDRSPTTKQSLLKYYWTGKQQGSLQRVTDQLPLATSPLFSVHKLPGRKVTLGALFCVENGVGCIAAPS